LHAAVLVAAALVGCERPREAPPPPPLTAEAYPHAGDSIGTVREIYDGVLSPELAVTTFRNIDRLFPTGQVLPGATPRALTPSARALGEVTFSDSTGTHSLEDYVRSNRVAALLVLEDGTVAHERYLFGNGPRTRWMSMSIAKSITSTLIGAAIHEGAIGNVDDLVTRYVPSLAGTAYDGVTIRQVLTMSSGAHWDETYTDPRSDRRRLLEAQIAQQSGAALEVMARLPRAAMPGSRHNYSTGETQIAAEILRGAVQRPLSTYLSERLWQPMGMEQEARWWLDAPGGIEIGGSGISATLRDYGRVGLFMLQDGVIDGVRYLPEGWVRDATSARQLPDGTPLPYGYLWWIPQTNASQRDGAFSAEGIHGQFLYINPAAKVVIVVWSAQPKPTGGGVFDDWTVFDAIVAALR
jgi:CubicO group peptidase (beta-lactamase class C family)